MSPIIILILALQALPPPPPGYVEPTKLLSPKMSEFQASLGSVMVKSSPLATSPTPAFTLGGFSVTNISFNSGQVTLRWQEGSPLFQVQGTSLNGQWRNISGLTTARTRTFPDQPEHFFRIAQSNSLPLIVNPTNQPRISWTVPQIDMSDSLTTYTLQERKTAPPANQAVSDNTGWSPEVPTPSPASNATSANGTTAPQVWYRLKQTTANGVVIPYGVASLTTGPVGGITLVASNSGPPSYPSSVTWTFPNFSLIPILNGMGTVSMKMDRFLVQRSPNNVDTPFSPTGQGTTNPSGMDQVSYATPPPDANWTNVLDYEYQGGYVVATSYGVGPAPATYPFTTNLTDLEVPNRVNHYRLIAILDINGTFYELDWPVSYSTKSFVLSASVSGGNIALSWN